MNKRITVIDDDADLRSLLQIALRNEGYDVTIFPNGNEFVNALDSLTPAHLYLIDINLGGISGFEVCRQIKSKVVQHESLVILISANPEVQQLATDVSADDYMLKPFTLKELLKKIQYLMDRQQV